MTSIEEFLESISYVPIDVKRNLGLMAELENREAIVKEQLHDYQQQLLKIIKLPSNQQNEALKLEVKEKVERMHLESLAFRREKELIARQTLILIQKCNQQFTIESNKFTEEFKNLPLSELIPNNPNILEENAFNTRNGGTKRVRENTNNYNIIQNYDSSFQYPMKTAKDKTKKQKHVPTPTIQIFNDFPIEEEQVIQENQQYCICNGVVQDEMMIMCDNQCKQLWFHYSCVNIVESPQDEEKWYCPGCRGQIYKKN